MAPATPELKKVRYDWVAVYGFFFIRAHGLAPCAYLPLHEHELTFKFLQYLDKRVFVQLNGSRKVIGVLRGYDVRPDGNFFQMGHS